MSSRFREVIGHGMWSGALISTVLGTEFPGPGTIYLGQNLRFRRPVKAGDTITIKVTATEKRDICQNAKQLEHLADAVSSGIVLGARVPIALTGRGDDRRTWVASAALVQLVARLYRQAAAALPQKR